MPIATLFLLLLLSPPTLAATFTCNGTTTKCNSMLGYRPPNSTTYSSILSLFTLPSPTLTHLLLANNLSSTASPSTKIPKGSLVRIPFPCSCFNGTGVSDSLPVYYVKPDDGLDHIARNIFNLFVEFLEIAKFNNISKPDLIEVNQRLVIPLPCSCDEVGGEKVLHYAYKVQKGDTLEAIQKNVPGSNSSTIMILNDIKDSKDLKEEDILDVPIKVCLSDGSLASTLLGELTNTSNCTRDAGKNTGISQKGNNAGSSSASASVDLLLLGMIALFPLLFL